MRIREASVLFAAAAAAAVSSLSLRAGELAVPADATAVLEVSGEERIVAPLIEGTLRKEGPGHLVLDEADFPDGVARIREGTLLLVATNTPSAAALPAWVPQTAALWFDAATHVVTGAGTNGVAQWLDVRETQTAAPYLFPRAVQHGSDPVPLLGAADPTLHGQPYLDFGGFGSGRWLKWVNPDDTRLALATIRHVFIVFGRQPGFGFLLGDWDWTQAGNIGRKDFHIASIGLSANDCAYWEKYNTADTVQFGQTYRNGRRVWDPWLERPEAGYQLFAVATTGDAYASNFCNDHNFKAGLPGVSVDRQGGPRYCEVVIFTNVLTMAEQKAVSDYLTEKWLTRAPAAGRLESLSGTQVEALSDAGHTLRVDGVTGEGMLVKSGPGILHLAHDTDLFQGATRVDEGSVISTSHRFDRGLAVVEGGQELFAATGTVQRAALGDTGMVRKSGSGELTIESVDSAVARIDVSAGTLRLSPPLALTSAADRAVIPNSGFETHSAVTQNAGLWQTGLTPDGWQLITDGNGKGGITLDTANTPWVGQDAIPEGGSAVFFQYHGGIKTTVQIPRSGFYRLSFQAAARYDSSAYRQHDFGVWLGTRQVAVAKTYFPVFERFEFVTPRLTNGTYELRFQGIVSTVSRASVIDDVRLDFLEDGTFAEIANAGFEYSDHLGTASGTATYQFAPGNAGWTFDGPTNTSGITESIGWVAPRVSIARRTPEGRRCGFIKGSGRIGQTIAFPATGAVYRLAIQTASREGYENHTFRILLDGEPLLAYQQTQQTYFQPLEITLPPATNWTADLVFEGLDAVENKNRFSLIDAARVFRIGTGPLSNGSFETTTSLPDGDYSGYATLCENAGWIFEADAADRKPGISGRHAYFGLPYHGGRMAFLQGQAVIRQTVALPEAGTYALSFFAASRIAPWQGYTFEVCWAGRRIAMVPVDTGFYRRCRFRLPRVTAGGTAELLFRGLDSSSNGALLDDVTLERLDVCDTASLLPPTTEISVTDGARLELDFEGVLPVAGVTLGGAARSRLIDATTYPEFVAGTGALYSPAKGTLISVR